MEQNKYRTPEERARITEIQDSLNERHVEQRDAFEVGNRCRAIELEFEIKELVRERENIEKWAAV